MSSDIRALGNLLVSTLDSLKQSIGDLPSSMPPGPLSSNIFELSNAGSSTPDWPSLFILFDTVYANGFGAAEVKGGPKGVVQIEKIMRRAGTAGLGDANDYLKALWHIQDFEKTIKNYIKDNPKT